jgi:hypothetical protein
VVMFFFFLLKGPLRRVKPLLEDAVHIQVWHDSLLKTFLGQLDLPIPPFGEKDAVCDWFTLEGRSRDEAISGDLRVSVELTSLGALKKKYREKPGAYVICLFIYHSRQYVFCARIFQGDCA